MAYVHIATSTTHTIDHFKEANELLAKDGPIEGLIAEAAGSSDQGFHVVSIWESKAPPLPDLESTSGGRVNPSLTLRGASASHPAAYQLRGTDPESRDVRRGRQVTMGNASRYRRDRPRTTRIARRPRRCRSTRP